MKLSEIASKFNISTQAGDKAITLWASKSGIDLWDIGPKDNLAEWFVNSVSYASDYLQSSLPVIGEVIEKRSKMISIERKPFVYWLFNGVDLVYIGQSQNLISRISKHREYFVFDSVSMIDDFNGINFIDYESICIRHFRPPGNREIITPYRYFSIVLQYVTK